MSKKPVIYSLLDLAPITVGSDAATSLRNTLDLAQHVEALGYHRFWLAEHHGIPGVASAATSVVIGNVAAGTNRIRVGAGGIMLSNHAPLVIAEQFGTLECLFPGRIDLGLGRAPGGDANSRRALRRFDSGGEHFPAELEELRSYFKAAPGQSGVQAIPGAGLDVPIYLLGSSDFSARLAASEGLPFAFASHFAPDYLLAALKLYRDQFIPSANLAKPHAMVGVNVFAADTDAGAQILFSSLQQAFLNMIRGRPSQLPAPVENFGELCNRAEAAHLERMTSCSVVGSPATIRAQFHDILDQTQADELVLTAHIYDHEARKHSFEIAAHVLDEMNASNTTGSSKTGNEFSTASRR